MSNMQSVGVTWKRSHSDRTFGR